MPQLSHNNQRLAGLQKLKFRVQKRKKQLKIPELYARSFARAAVNPNKINPRENVEPTWPEKVVATILQANNIKYVREYEVMTKFFDFFLPELNLLLEIDGIYWHGRDKKQENMKVWEIRNRCNDVVKNALSGIKPGRKLLRIWEDEVSEKHLLNLIEYAKNSNKTGLIIPE